MGKKFKFFKYDLAQNLVDYKSNDRYHQDPFHSRHRKFASLYDHSLILFLANIFKDSGIIEAIKKTIDSLRDPKDPTDNDMIKIEELESKTTESCVSKGMPNEYFEYKENFFGFLIHFMLLQIFDLFIKGTMHKCLPLDVYLQNLEFTCQGTINLKKTVIRILRKSLLPKVSQFEVACYYFVEKDIIHNLYYNIKTEEREKYFTNKNFITCYPLYYWIWKIHGTRKLVSVDNDFYAQSVSTWSRSDLQKDVAMVCIFQKAVEDNNELAVQHLWSHHISKMPQKCEILSNALKLIFSDATKINICLYLLFQIQNNESKNLLEFISYEIMKNIIKDIRWHDLTLKIFPKLEIYLKSGNGAELLSILNANLHLSYPIGRSVSLL